jgi:hypothetical protein
VSSSSTGSSLSVQKRAYGLGALSLLAALVLFASSVTAFGKGDVVGFLVRVALAIWLAWWILSAPYALYVEKGVVGIKGLKPKAADLKEIDRVILARTKWGVPVQRFCRRDGSSVLEFEAGLFDRRRVSELLKAGGFQG